jgi:hypothetical protein
MRRRFRMLATLGGIAAAATALLAQQPPPPPKPAIQGQMPELGRPTRSDDTLPLFDFNQYFVGTWTFEWDVPEGPLGPAGRIAGTTTYKKIADGFFEGVTQATGPVGPIRWTEVIAYRDTSKTLARHVVDSRGFSFLQIAPIGGDLGGYYNIYYDSAPFVHDGRTLRIRTGMHLLSPIHYKVNATVSVNGGRFTNYGSPWWRKDVSSGGKP